MTTTTTTTTKPASTDAVRATFPYLSADRVAYLAERLDAVDASLAHGRGRGL